MKYILFLSILSLLMFTGYAQDNDEGKVKISLKNSSWLPKKVTLVSYEPGETGNGTNGFMLLPGFSKSFTFKEGTKLYLADQKQVDVVMSGARIDECLPFRIITKEDKNKTIKLPE